MDQRETFLRAIKQDEDDVTMRMVYADCPVDDAMRETLVKYAQKMGRYWKSKLREDWDEDDLQLGDINVETLRRIRNVIGPRGLDRVTPKMLEQTREQMERNLKSQADGKYG